jgi:hypothetical protein
MPGVLKGLGAALAVSFPAVVIGIVVLALEDRDADLEPVLRALLLIAVLVGPAVGGAVAAADDPSRLASLVVGVVALVLITAFGLAREVAADSDPNVGLVLPAALVGAVLGWVGGTLRTAWPGRTRR